jgi:hypothetical protein
MARRARRSTPRLILGAILALVVALALGAGLGYALGHAPDYRHIIHTLPDCLGFAALVVSATVFLLRPPAVVGAIVGAAVAVALDVGYAALATWHGATWTDGLSTTELAIAVGVAALLGLCSAWVAAPAGRGGGNGRRTLAAIGTAALPAILLGEGYAHSAARSWARGAVFWEGELVLGALLALIGAGRLRGFWRRVIAVALALAAAAGVASFGFGAF